MGPKEDNDSSNVKRKNTNISIKFSSVFDLLRVVFIFFVIDLMVSIDFMLELVQKVLL
jgi:hypothetical protein